MRQLRRDTSELGRAVADIHLSAEAVRDGARRLTGIAERLLHP